MAGIEKGEKGEDVQSRFLARLVAAMLLLLRLTQINSIFFSDYYLTFRPPESELLFSAILRMSYGPFWSKSVFSLRPFVAGLSPRTWRSFSQSRAESGAPLHDRFSRTVRQKPGSDDEPQPAAEETVAHGRQQQLGHSEGNTVRNKLVHCVSCPHFNV